MNPIQALRWQNFVSSTGIVVLALGAHRLAEQNRAILAKHYGTAFFSFTGTQFLLAAAGVYIVLLGFFFLLEPDPRVSKSLRFWQLAAAFFRAPRLILRQPLPREDRVAVLATLLKALFGPLMTMALMTAAMSLVANAWALTTAGTAGYSFRVLYDRHLHWFLFQLIVMADVLVFTIGYLVELPRLGNQIRSVDPTLLGWAAALLCYTPFNIVLSVFLATPGSEFPRFDSDAMHYTANGLLLLMMGIYTWASVALGFKASNLTHRGIVSRGPYRWVRHPAYACKNMAWWIGSIPIVALAFDKSTFDGIQALASIVGWSMLYVLRAVTEEDHLRSVDGDFADYAAKVRYRFIPGLI